MERVRLKVMDVLGILNGEGVALMILTDEAEMRQVSVICDKATAYQAELRIKKTHDTHKLIPEALTAFIRQKGGAPMEIVIHGVAAGQYQAVSRDMLQKALNQAVEEENYELASHLRDEMNKREENANK